MNQSSPVSKEQLEQAFLLFNQASQELSHSYAALQTQVDTLNRQLAAAHSGRMHQLAEKERYAHRFALLLDALLAAVLVLDGDERLCQFNPAAGGLFPGISRGDDWSVICRDHVRERQEDELHLRTGQVLRLSEQSLDSEAERILLLLDITAAHELQQRTQRQQRLSAMGQMAAQLAHQIRTPLSSALLYSSHLSRDDLSAGQRARFARRTRATLLQMEQQINDMLDFTRGGDARCTESVDLGGLLREIAQTLEPLARARGLALRCVIAAEAQARVEGNRSALLGAVTNIGRNALEHCEADGCVTLELQDGGSVWQLLVSDEGPGVPEAIRARIFDPFFTTRGQGTGLGLAVSQAVALGHGGCVSVDREAVKGACFRFSLPKTQAATPAPSTKESISAPELRRAV